MLKLGEKIISDIYLGDKKIAKVFWGDKLVYQANKPIFLDYVIFDGASWIDTNVVPVFGDELEVCASIGDTVNGVNYSLFGAGTSSSQFLSLFETKYLLNRYFGSTAGRGSLEKKETLSKLKFKNNGSVYVDDVQIIAPFDVSNNTVNTVLSIGARGGGTQPWLGKIGALILTSSTGAVKLNLRPCIDTKGTVCFYDMVTKKYFYNKGTGTLTAGNKIKFVDYIRFDGDSWIDVGYAPTNNTRVVGKFSITKFKGYGANYVFGVFSDNANYGLNIGSNREMLNVPWASVSAVAMNNPNNLGQVYAFDISKNGAYIDGEQKITASQLTATFTATKTFFIGWSNGTSTDKLIGNIYPVQIYENDVLVRDLRPCVIASAIGLYDMVTGKFYTNIGTGTLKASGRFVTSILFDGASYIDTGIKHQTCDVECDLRFAVTGARQLMGFGTSTAQYWGAGATGTFDYVNNTDATVKNNLVIQFNTNNPSAPTKTMFLNGKQIGGVSTGSSISNYTYTIGAAGTNIKAYYMTGEVWGNKFTNADGVIIQDLRPYVDENNVACFKDVVTGNLFYNQGTGTLGYTEE